MTQPTPRSQFPVCCNAFFCGRWQVSGDWQLLSFQSCHAKLTITWKEIIVLKSVLLQMFWSSTTHYYKLFWGMTCPHKLKKGCTGTAKNSTEGCPHSHENATSPTLVPPSAFQENLESRLVSFICKYPVTFTSDFHLPNLLWVPQVIFTCLISPDYHKCNYTGSDMQVEVCTCKYTSASAR